MSFFGSPEKYKEQYGNNVNAVIGATIRSMVIGNPSSRQYQKALKLATNENLNPDQREIMSKTASEKGDFLSDHMEVTVIDPNLHPTEEDQSAG